MKRNILLIAIMIVNVHCDNPVDNKSDNQRPVIISLTVFPEVIGTKDSAIVICNAFDPDGDTLVYDWTTDGKSKIKGAPAYQDWNLYNTFENWRIVFPKNLNNIPIDTLWIQCFARDRKGKSDQKLVFLLLKK